MQVCQVDTVAELLLERVDEQVHEAAHGVVAEHVAHLVQRQAREAAGELLTHLLGSQFHVDGLFVSIIGRKKW